MVVIAGTAFFIYSYGISRTFDPPNVFSSATLISAALIGCCVGFLPHNYHPARLFMGDSGALLLGLLLAAATISTTGNVTPAQVSTNPVAATLLPLVVPAAIILLPLVDILLAVVRRTARGERPWQPDKQHLHHRMLQLGHGHRRAVLLLWLWAAVAALGSVSFIFVDDARVAGAGVAGRHRGHRRADHLAAALVGPGPPPALALTASATASAQRARHTQAVASRPARTAGHSSRQHAEHHRVAEAAVGPPRVPAQHALAGGAELGDGGLRPQVDRVGLDLDPAEAAVEGVPEQQQLALGVDLACPTSASRTWSSRGGSARSRGRRRRASEVPTTVPASPSPPSPVSRTVYAVRPAPRAAMFSSVLARVAARSAGGGRMMKPWV